MKLLKLYTYIYSLYVPVQLAMTCSGIYNGNFWPGEVPGPLKLCDLKSWSTTAITATDLGTDADSFDFSDNTLTQAFFGSISIRLSNSRYIKSVQNSVTEMPDFSHSATTLLSLRLADNKITCVSLEALSIYTVLEYLDLSRNPITVVEPFVHGTDIISLKQFLCWNCKIQVFSEFCSSRFDSIASNGFKFGLAGNFLNCTACIAWMKTCPYKINLDNAQCSTFTPHIQYYTIQYGVTESQLMQTPCTHQPLQCQHVSAAIDTTSPTHTTSPTESETTTSASEIETTMLPEAIQITLPMEIKTTTTTIPSAIDTTNAKSYSLTSGIFIINQQTDRNNALILHSTRTRSRVHCAVVCDRVQGKSFDYSKPDMFCYIYSTYGGQYKVST